MSDTLDELNELREARLHEIKGHKGHIESLQGEVGRLEGEVRGLDMAIEICNREMKGSSAAPALKPAPQTGGKYADKKLTEAMMDILQSAGLSPGLNMGQIEDILIKNGYKTNAKSLYSSIYTIARRLARQGTIREVRMGDARVYTKK